MHEVIIVGAGLSGLAAAFYLKRAGVKALVVEARERKGGRILTVPAAGQATPVEMGATWFADKHLYFMQLMQELELSFFKQYQSGIGVMADDVAGEPRFFQVPPGEDASYRVGGGTSRLIEALEAYIGPENIILNAPVAAITEHPDHLVLHTRQGESFACRHLVLTVPPALVVSQQIRFEPALPAPLVQVMANTHTWMGEAIKFAVEYASPFWRRKGLSGTVFWPGGAVPEVYDHTNEAETRFALKGFLAPDTARDSAAGREAAVIAHLVRQLGPEAGQYLSYTEKVWQQEVFTFGEQGRLLPPHQHNGHPLYSRPLMQGRLYLSGTETSPCFGGYMDGAVYSGRLAAGQILRRQQPG